MPKVVKWGTTADEIDEVEVGESEFEPYEGPLPPKNTILTCDVKYAKLAKFASGSKGLKVLLVANDPEDGPKSKYDGLPIWDNLVDVQQNAWKTRQWMDAIGGTGADWVKTTVEDPGGEGAKVLKFGAIRTEGLQVRVQTSIGHNQNDEPRAEVGRYLPKAAAGAAKAAAKGKGRQAEADDDDADDDPPF